MANLNPNNMNVKQLTAVIKILDGKIKDAESAKDAPAARRLKNIQNKYITARSKIIAYVTAQQKKGIDLTASKKNALRLIDIGKNVNKEQGNIGKAIDWLEDKKGFVIGIGSTLTALTAANAISQGVAGKGLLKVIWDAIAEAAIANPAVAGWAFAASAIGAATVALAVAPSVKRAVERSRDKAAARQRAESDFEFDEELTEAMEQSETALTAESLTSGKPLNDLQLEEIARNPEAQIKIKRIINGSEPGFEAVSPHVKAQLIDVLNTVETKKAEAEDKIKAFNAGHKHEINNDKIEKLSHKSAAIIIELDEKSDGYESRSEAVNFLEESIKRTDASTIPEARMELLTAPARMSPAVINEYNEAYNAVDISDDTLRAKDDDKAKAVLFARQTKSSLKEIAELTTQEEAEKALAEPSLQDIANKDGDVSKAIVKKSIINIKTKLGSIDKSKLTDAQKTSLSIIENSVTAIEGLVSGASGDKISCASIKTHVDDLKPALEELTTSITAQKENSEKQYIEANMSEEAKNKFDAALLKADRDLAIEMIAREFGPKGKKAAQDLVNSIEEMKTLEISDGKKLTIEEILAKINDKKLIIESSRSKS